MKSKIFLLQLDVKDGKTASVVNPQVGVLYAGLTLDCVEFIRTEILKGDDKELSTEA